MVIARNGYTDQEILDALKDERREVDFCAYLLDSSNTRLKTISTIDKMNVSYDSQSRDVNRLLKFSYREDLGFTERFEYEHSADWVVNGNGTAPFAWDTTNGELLGINGFDCQYIIQGRSYTDVELEFASNQMHNGGLVARFQDQNNFYLLLVSDDSGANPTNNLILFKKVNGSFTALGASNQVFVRSGPTATIRFRVQGSKLKAFLNGVLVIDVSDTAISVSGGVGLWCNNATIEDHYQYFSCTSLDVMNFLSQRIQPCMSILMPRLTSITETTQADFQTGTLTNVQATSAGDLTLSGGVGTYSASGNRVAPAFSPSSSSTPDYLKQAIISWSADVPAACTLIVDVKIGSGSYQRATNGQSVPGLIPGDDLVGKTVTVKVSMTTSDANLTPSLHDISMRFLSSSLSDWIEFPLGVFVMPTNKPSSGAGNITTYTIDGQDLMNILLESVVKNRYYISASTNYVTAIKAVLSLASITNVNIVASSLTLPTSLEYEPGTSYLEIIDSLIDALGYVRYFDENGQFIAYPWLNPLVKTPTYSFVTDRFSLIEPEASVSLDAYKVPNVVVLIVSEPELTTALRSEKKNTNPDSPTSIVNRGREIVKVIKNVRAPDQTTLDAIAAQTLFEVSQIYEQVDYKSALLPIFGHDDSVHFEFDPLRLSASYEVLGWEMECAVGGQMTFHIRRIVTV